MLTNDFNALATSLGQHCRGKYFFFFVSWSRLTPRQPVKSIKRIGSMENVWLSKIDLSPTGPLKNSSPFHQACHRIEAEGWWWWTSRIRWTRRAPPFGPSWQIGQRPEGRGRRVSWDSWRKHPWTRCCRSSPLAWDPSWSEHQWLVSGSVQEIIDTSNRVGDGEF